ncbi:UNVERIFIED_CONTAM: hypothetical protein FKN15_005710 [Acipenser sinensis]
MPRCLTALGAQALPDIGALGALMLLSFGASVLRHPQCLWDSMFFGASMLSALNTQCSLDASMLHYPVTSRFSVLWYPIALTPRRFGSIDAPERRHLAASAPSVLTGSVLWCFHTF